jgi:hypothetical protein
VVQEVVGSIPIGHPKVPITLPTRTASQDRSFAGEAVQAVIDDGVKMTKKGLE